MSLRALLRQAWLVALVVGICAGAAGAYTKLEHPVYRSTMKVVIGQADSFFQPDVANATEIYTQTMSDLVKSDVVASTVVDRLNLDVSPTLVVNNLQVSTQPSAAVLDISYDDTDRTRGLRTLEEVGSVFIEQVHDRLAPTSADQGKPAISVIVFDPAHVLPGVVRPKPLLNLAGAAGIGLILGVLAAVIRVQLAGPAVPQLRQLERKSL
jgi:capsular polysaccharide biosynthesis protein